MSAVAFLLAIGTALVAVSPPFDALADGSFAWHMFQHVILLFVVAPLLLLSRPLRAIALHAPKSSRTIVVAASRVTRVAASPFVALPVFVGTLWSVHFSGLYELALQHPWIHASEHALLLFAGLLFWLPVLEPIGAPPSLGPAARVLYLFVALPQCALVGMAILSARHPLYAHYTRTLGSAAVADQHDAAALMWIAGGTVVLIAILATLFAWARREMAQPAC